MEQKNYFETEWDLRQLFYELLKKVKKIISVGVVLAVLFSGYKYITSGSDMIQDTRIVNQTKHDYLGTARIFLGSESIASTSTTARIYLSGSEMLEGAIKELNLDMNYEKLRNMIYLDNSTDTMINVSVLGADKTLVQDITNYLATTGSANLAKKLRNYDVTLLEPAFTVYREYNEEKTETFQNITKLAIELVKNAIIGFILGIFIAVAAYIILFITDVTIKNENDVYRYLDIPVLGTVSIIKGTKKNVENGKRKRKFRLSQYSEHL